MLTYEQQTEDKAPLQIMERLPRYFVAGQAQHIIQRGNNRDVIFVADEDYRFYLECLAEAAERHGLQIHAYVLMTNHVHLLATPKTKDSIPKTLQSVGRRYVQYFNYCYQRTGTLWEGRYKATLIDSDSYLLTCSRYIEFNPVRAGMVVSPEDYPWSSYRINALGDKSGLLTPHSLYKALGITEAERQSAYRGLFEYQIPEVDLNVIRQSTNKGWVLGGERFKERIETFVLRRTSPLPKGRPSKTDEEIRD